MLEYVFHEIVENCEAHCIEFHGALDIVNFMSLNLDSYCTSCFICVDLCGIVENYKKLEHFVRNTINCLILV